MKMNIKNLKVGDKVFIKEGLVPGKFYGALTYERNMAKGWCEVSGVFSKNGGFSVKTDNGKCWEILYSYTPEMVDWNKTIKLRRKKMKIKDLKVGDVVYIRKDLENDKLYGNNVYIDDMCKGIQEISFISRENGIIRTVETPDYSYTSEMIDWEKTREIREMDFKEIIQYGECGNEITKGVTYGGKEIVVKNNREENDPEKATMLLMLKARGVTYSDIKEEAKKVEYKWIPKQGEKYYWIGSYFEINWYFWEGLSVDRVLSDRGNCFKTRGEAEKKLSKIKDILKGE